LTKQQKTVGLLVAVLIVWGAIGYQIFMRLQPNSGTTAIEIQRTFTPQKYTEKEFHTIKEPYRDPFLGKFPATKVIRTKKVKKLTVVFPSIVYNGIISGNTSQSYILTINGRQELFKLKETLNEVTLLKATVEEVKISYKGNKKTILLQI
jgi:hypothetical protein